MGRCWVLAGGVSYLSPTRMPFFGMSLHSEAGACSTSQLKHDCTCTCTLARAYGVRAMNRNTFGASIAAGGQAYGVADATVDHAVLCCAVLTWHDRELHSFREVIEGWQSPWHLVFGVLLCANTCLKRSTAIRCIVLSHSRTLQLFLVWRLSNFDPAKRWGKVLGLAWAKSSGDLDRIQHSACTERLA